MTALVHQPQTPRVRLEPVRFHNMLLDGRWWPRSADLRAELDMLVPVLDRVRGPVVRLLLSAGGWTTRPHAVRTDDRDVSIGYLAAQSPSMLTVFCADGGCFTMHVGPPLPAGGPLSPVASAPGPSSPVVSAPGPSSPAAAAAGPSSAERRATR